MAHTPITQEVIQAQLKKVRYPGFSRDIVSFGVVRSIEIAENGRDVAIQLMLATNQPEIPQQIKNDVTLILRALPGIGELELKFEIKNPLQTSTGVGPQQIPGIKHVIAVASGKGGVGKSTVASNLALALERTGAKVGLCDCDLYGPSIGLMFGVDRQGVTATEDETIIPVEAYEIKLMSMSFILSDEAPAILRGPMVTKLTQQFLRRVLWNELDYLILDLPPGTGDIQLTIVQTVAISGAIIVTTPQEVALIDARKAATMFAKTNVPVLGLVENMSFFLCPSDQKQYNIFGTGGGERESKRLKVPLLGKIPIDMATREGGDKGLPVVLAEPAGAVAQEFGRIAQHIRQTLSV